MKLVQFGAGNIGRSFIGQLFARGGYEVVFVDIDRRLIETINREQRYRVMVKHNDGREETLWVEGVRAVDGRATDQVSREIAGAQVVGTSVGKGALEHLFPVISAGLLERERQGIREPIEIIIAENIRGGSAFFRESLLRQLPPEFPFSQRVGLVETSIGKMVPIMTGEDIQRDPLWVFAEAYNTLIVDRRGFLAGVPDLPGIKAVENINAYVDRKLFVHNLGHAATAYFGYAYDPAFTYIWEPLTVREVVQKVTAAMREAAAALNREYPQDLPADELEEHIQDLLRRFANRSLGDTIYRVGRDLYRKLNRDDRLVGACLLAARHGLPFDQIAAAIRAAFEFRGRDEHGLLFPGDRAFSSQEAPKGLKHVLEQVCKLDPTDRADGVVIERILSSG